MSSPPSPLERMAAKLATRVQLDDDDRAAILALPHVQRSYHPSTYIIREGERPRDYCAFIQSGFAFRQKLTAQGGRQIVSIHLAGDFIDLQNLFLGISDHNVQALTEVKAIGLERAALQRLTLDRPTVGRAMWIDALVEASIYREWVLNLGRRDARARIAHVLCELALRLQAAGLGTADRFELPLTQEQLGDAVGLTPVHVNRVLRLLEQEGVVHRERRFLGFASWRDVSRVGDFNPLYLHLDQVKAI